MRALAVWASMPVQADAAIRLEESAEDYDPDDAINRGKRIQKAGKVKHLVSFQRISIHSYELVVCDLDHMKRFAADLRSPSGENAGGHRRNVLMLPSRDGTDTR
jgi:hypothetical protein